MPKQKVFMSYEHNNKIANNEKSDTEYRNEFEEICYLHFDIIISKPIEDEKIYTSLTCEKIQAILRNQYLRDSSVTVVLIGNETWQSKHIDWEIAASLNSSNFNLKSGVIGIVLPSCLYKEEKRSTNVGKIEIEDSNDVIDIRNIPERLAMNINNDYVKIYNWTNSSRDIQSWIHDAYTRSNRITPDNSLELYSENKPYSIW